MPVGPVLPVRRRSRRLVLAAAGALLLGGLGTSPALGAVGDTSVVADDGAKIVSETKVDDRTVDLAIQSPALGHVGMVRVQTPVSWTTTPTKKYPTLYLHHGANEPEDYKSWTVFTDVETWALNKDMLVVMPTGGGSGFYSKEYNYGMPGGEDYDTFHNKEVAQIIERGYRGSTTRAIAGLSMGGFGAMSYAARYPGFYKAAASYSGLLNTLFPSASAFVQFIRIRDNRDPYSLWGWDVSNRDIWIKYNPTDQAAGLRGTRLFVSVGNGQQGPFDESPVSLPIEGPALSQSESFRDKLTSLGIPATYDFYGAGTHSWPYWQRELKRSWPVLAAGLGLPVDPKDIEPPSPTPAPTPTDAAKPPQAPPPPS